MRNFALLTLSLVGLLLGSQVRSQPSCTFLLDSTVFVPGYSLPDYLYIYGRSEITPTQSHENYYGLVDLATTSSDFLEDTMGWTFEEATANGWDVISR